MAERPDDRPQARPIVPDPDSSLSAHRPRQPPPPRVWPLWLLVVLLVGALGGLAWAGWEARARFEGEIARLAGELSNVHARFDMDEGRGDTLEVLESRLDTLEVNDEEMLSRLDEQQEGVGERLVAMDERIDELQQRLIRIGEAAATREAMLAATQASLDALERLGEEGRASLSEQLAAIEDQRGRDIERLASLAERVDSLETTAVDGEALGRLESALTDLEERLTREERELRQRLEDTNARMAGLSGEVDALAASREEGGERIDTLTMRLGALEAELSELRRSQLALSARLEVLRQ